MSIMSNVFMWVVSFTRSWVSGVVGWRKYECGCFLICKGSGGE